MPLFSKPDEKNLQSIIQWHAMDQERPQENFKTNAESIHLTGESIAKSKDNHFKKKTYSSEEFTSSFKIQNKSYKSFTQPTDIFLYGHSTYRDYVTPKSRGGMEKKQVRGISIDHSYVSASKVVKYLSHVFPYAQKAENPVRVWLMSCHTAHNDLDDAGEVYGKSFAEKLSVKGWKNARVIGFEQPVNYWDTLPKVRELASKTKLFSPLDFPKSVAKLNPHIWRIGADGDVSNVK